MNIGMNHNSLEQPYGCKHAKKYDPVGSMTPFLVVNVCSESTAKAAQPSVMQMCENITVAHILMGDTSRVVENEDSVVLLILFDLVRAAASLRYLTHFTNHAI